jgi:integrase/recombinase XerD
MGRGQARSALDIRQAEIAGMGTGKRGDGAKPSNLYKRNGIYYARVTVGGVPKRESLKTGDRREAERRLKRWLADRSPYHGTVRHDFAEAAALWVKAGAWKPKTTAGYMKLLQGVILPHFADLFWDQVDKAEIQRFIAARQAQGATNATINRALTVVSGIADHVRELPGWPEINPVRLVSAKSRKPKKWTYVRPPESDVEAYFARMKGTFGDLCRFALLTGARRDEAALLQRDHVRGGNATFYDTKSGIPRTIELVAEARAITARQPVTRSPHLFNSRNATPYKRVTEMWREVVLRAQKMAQRDGCKLTPMRFHDLRHEYAIRYLEKGGSLYTLQQLLGHGSIKQTERYLDYFTPAEKARIMEGVAQ